MASARFFLGALLAISTGAGCARELSLRAPGFNVRRAKVVCVPAMVALYAIDENAHLDFDEARSKQARLKVNTWLRYLAPAVNSRVADLREVAGTELPADPFYDRMNNIARAIVADWGKRALPSWSVGPELQSWAPALKADYLVFVSFRGGYETQARKTANAWAFLGGEQVIGIRHAALLVVDLQTSLVVRARVIKFEGLENLEIPDDLSHLMEALDLGQPIKVVQP